MTDPVFAGARIERELWQRFKAAAALADPQKKLADFLSEALYAAIPESLREGLR